MNNQKINFAGQTKATVKTNEDAIELPLLITKAQTALLIGMDWTQRLRIQAIQVHYIKVENTEKRTTKRQTTLKIYPTITKR